MDSCTSEASADEERSSYDGYFLPLRDASPTQVYTASSLHKVGAETAQNRAYKQTSYEAYDAPPFR